MTLFEVLVLNKLYSTPDGNSGCGCLFALIVFTCLVVFLLEHFKIVLISLLAIIIITIMILTFTRLFSFYRWRSILEKAQKAKEKQEFNLLSIKNFAEKYISEIITENKTELTQEDYKNFYELVKENNIEVSNDYATSVPYVVRNLLYEAYLKGSKKFLRGKEK